MINEILNKIYLYDKKLTYQEKIYLKNILNKVNIIKRKVNEMQKVTINKKELNEICEIAKSLIKYANGDSVIEDRAYNILIKAQNPLQELDPQNI